VRTASPRVLATSEHTPAVDAVALLPVGERPGLVGRGGAGVRGPLLFAAAGPVDPAAMTTHATASAGRLASTVEGITAQALPGAATARHPCRGGAAVAFSVGRMAVPDAACGSGERTP
jgi:hypothetical protein